MAPTQQSEKWKPMRQSNKMETYTTIKWKLTGGGPMRGQIRQSNETMGYNTAG